MKIVGALIPLRDLAIILFAVFGLVVGCSNALNYQVAKLTKEQRAQVQQILTADQVKKLDDWIARNATANKGLPTGVTIELALKDQADWLVKQKAEAAKADEFRKQKQTARTARQEEFARMLSVTLVSKTNKVFTDEQRLVVFEVAYANRTDKDIHGVKGVLKLTNIYGDSVIDLNWSYVGRISAKQTVVDRDAAVSINSLIEPQVDLWNTDFEKLKSTFEIEKIILKVETSVSDSP
jgi:hypothetical protein